MLLTSSQTIFKREFSDKMSVTEDNPATPVSNDSDKKTAKFVVASQVREFVKSRNFCVGSDLIDALSNKVESLLATAALRAESNGRKTLRAQDL